jgi:NitT/TauT family transport system substrate-binding protein
MDGRRLPALRKAIALGIAVAGMAFCSVRATAAPLTTLHLGLSIDDDAMSVIYAEKAGLFRKAGIHVVLERQGSGAAIAASVLAGAYDIGKAGLVALFNAHVQGARLSMIAPAGLYESRAPYAALVVARDSSIRTAAGLRGKTIGVPGLQSLNSVVTSAWVDEHGGNSRTLRFLELPLAEAADGVARHHVDAAILVNPALAEAVARKRVRVLGPAMNAVGPSFLLSAWFANDDWADAHRDIVRKFARAVAEAAAYTNEHHDETAKLLADATSVPLPVIQGMTRVTNGTTLRVADLQPLLDVSIKYAVLPHGFFVRDLIYRGIAGK